MDLDNNDIICNKFKKHADCYYINDIYHIFNSSIDSKKYNKILSSFINNFLFIVSMILSYFLLLFNLFFEYKIDYNNKIAIARVYRTKVKISRVHKNIQFIEDDIKNYDFTIYRIGPKLYRFKFLINSYFKLCIRDFRRVKEILNDEDINFSQKILFRIAKRIPHTIVYYNSMEYIMSNYNLLDIYTGQMRDRFALIEERLSNKYKKRLICIPHGIESTKDMPVGYIGDVFYCSSPQMASKLNILYKTSKFTFNDEITSRMYRNNRKNQYVDRNKKVVFFTQPKDIKFTKKIIFIIAQYLKSKNEKLYIKVHPLERKSDYLIENTEIINSFEEAIFGNLCISLSSTVLLEALYNDSLSLSIIYLVNDVFELTGDNQFLNDTRILKPQDKVALFKIIDEFL
ncbi:TPA: hypothetical protein ACG3RW_003952 [Clostridioides difficile]